MEVVAYSCKESHVNCFHIPSLFCYVDYGPALHNEEIYIKIQGHIFLVHFDIHLPFYPTVRAIQLFK
jgi:hypothetical protein